MRALGALIITGIALAGLGMPVAIIGRAMDWSPYALVMLGAATGLLVGIGFTMFLYVTGEDWDDDAD